MELLIQVGIRVESVIETEVGDSSSELLEVGMRVRLVVTI